MEKKIRTLYVGLIALLFSSIVFAQSSIKYIQFTFSAYDAPGISYPVFIFQQLKNGQWKQVGYVPDENKNIYVGPLKSSEKTLFKIATAQLNQKQTTVKEWTSGCEVGVQQFKITSNTCVTSSGDPIAVLDTKDAKKGADFANISFGSNEPLPPLAINAQPTAYFLPNYKKNRTVTFYNLTNYPEIGLSRLINAPNYPTYVLSPGQTHTYTLAQDTLGSSLAWVVSGYSKQAGCQPGESCWIYTGGYFNATAGSHTYATKVEGTIHTVRRNSYGLKSVANANIDLSAVDGFNFKMILVPTQLTYCTKNPASEWSVENTVAYVDQFSPQNPLASIPNLIVTKKAISYPKIKAICNAISSAHFIGTDLEPSAYIANLFVNDSNNGFMGCMSPCAYATEQVTANNTAFIKAFSQSENGQNIIDKFCCSGVYGKKKAICDAANFINQTSYVRMLDGSDGVVAHPSQAKFKNTYSYQFDDPNANIGCPGDTHYAVYIFNGKTAPTINYLTAANNVWVNPGKTSVEFGWHAPLDSQKNPNINYEAVVMQNHVPVKNGFCDRASPDHTCDLPQGTLKKNTQYELKITAFDGANKMSHSKLIHFGTRGGKINPFTVSPTITKVSESGFLNATINWTQAHDANTPKHSPIFYIVTAQQEGSNTAPVVQTISPQTLSATFSGLKNSGEYVFSVQAEDTVMHNGFVTPNYSSTTTSTYTISQIQPATHLRASNITSDSATITWNAANDSRFNANKTMQYTVLITENFPGSKTNAYTVGNNLSLPLTKLSAGKTYIVQVAATDEDSAKGVSAVSAPRQFETLPPFEIKTPIVFTQKAAVIRKTRYFNF